MDAGDQSGGHQSRIVTGEEEMTDTKRRELLKFAALGAVTSVVPLAHANRHPAPRPTSLPYLDRNMYRSNTDVVAAFDMGHERGSKMQMMSIGPRRFLFNHRDVIEVTDQATGYLRTGWNVWQRNGGRVIRTRVIVKQSSTTPLKYSIKLQSEYAPPGTSIKDDERFQPWDRILLTYKDLINEAQSRLR